MFSIVPVIESANSSIETFTAKHSCNFNQEGFSSSGAIAVHVYEGNAFRLYIEGNNPTGDYFEETIYLTQEDVESIKDSEGINPQKLIKFIFKVAKDLLAGDSTNPD